MLKGGVAALTMAFALVGSAANEQVEADEEGGFFSETKTATVVSSDWGLKPLGEPGNLKTDPTFKHQAEFRARPAYAEGEILIGASNSCVVVAPDSDWRMQHLAKEVAAHLEAMSGKTVKIENAAPTGPAVMLKWLEGDDERMSVKTEGNRIWLSGNGAGLNHAVTYFLEALGCRYLWPGRLGKVVPRREQIRLPVIDFTAKPAFRVRAMRGGPIAPWAKQSRDRSIVSLKRVGIDPEAYRDAFNAAYGDNAVGVRSFYAWHGILDSEECRVTDGGSRASLKEGHYFGDYYAKFAKSHPEFFALQRSGTRSPDQVGGKERPCFCYSNPEFIRAVAAELVKDYAGRRKHKRATTISPPDGGSMRPCMCANCRRLDPQNAPRVKVSFPNVQTGKSEFCDYVSYTDRMMYFFNAVLAEIRKTYPERGLTFYPYSNYRQPPVKVRPDPGLIPFSVAGVYTDALSWTKARENVAAWINLGLECYWRPNALNGWRPAGPQNFSRFLYEDIETMKANGLKGCEFDCVSGSWGAKGLDFYMTARAQHNPDRLSYEDQLNDYCRAGFGAAAEAVKRYFLAVERMNREAAKEAAKRGGAKELDFRRKAAAQDYVTALNIEELKSLLRAAQEACGGDATVNARLKMLAIAVRHGEFNRKIALGSASERSVLQEAYAEFVRKSAMEVPNAVTPIGICFYSPFMYDYRRAQ